MSLSPLLLSITLVPRTPVVCVWLYRISWDNSEICVWFSVGPLVSGAHTPSQESLLKFSRISAYYLFWNPFLCSPCFSAFLIYLVTFFWKLKCFFTSCPHSPSTFSSTFENIWCLSFASSFHCGHQGNCLRAAWRPLSPPRVLCSLCLPQRPLSLCLSFHQPGSHTFLSEFFCWVACLPNHILFQKYIPSSHCASLFPTCWVFLFWGSYLWASHPPSTLYFPLGPTQHMGTILVLAALPFL